MIALVAIQSLTYGERAVGAGERFDATPIDAAVLTYRRRAAFAPRGQVAPPPAPVVPPEPTPVRRVRRASVDEDREPDAETESTARRRYRRRDLEPEA